MLLISPISGNHHLVYMVPPAILVTLKLVTDREWHSWGPIFAGVLFWVFYILASIDDLGSYYFLQLVVLFGLVAWMTVNRRAEVT